MRKISLAEPVTQLRRIPIVDNGEPLVDFLELCPGLAMDPPRFKYRRETLLRESVARMICRADRLLPKGFRFAIVEGWRPPHIQRRMYLAVWNQFKELHPEWSDARLLRVVNQFTAPLNPRVPPPHTTGGAVDLMLTDDAGKRVDLTSPYEYRDPQGFYSNAPGLSETARRHRQIMAEALTQTGITNYPSEYWHWSYGDQGWAYRGGHPHALYASVAPPGYEPDPADDVDGPLVFIENT